MAEEIQFTPITNVMMHWLHRDGQWGMVFRATASVKGEEVSVGTILLPKDAQGWIRYLSQHHQESSEPQQVQWRIRHWPETQDIQVWLATTDDPPLPKLDMMLPVHMAQSLRDLLTMELQRMGVEPESPSDSP